MINQPRNRNVGSPERILTLSQASVARGCGGREAQKYNGSTLRCISMNAYRPNIVPRSSLPATISREPTVSTR